MNLFLHQKQEPSFIITKSVNQYPNIKVQTSDEIQPLEFYENCTDNFDDMLLWKRKSNINFFSKVDDTVILIFTMYLKVNFTSRKLLFVLILE